MKIKSKLIINGNSYALTIPKALVDSEILTKGKHYIINDIEEYIITNKKQIINKGKGIIQSQKCGNWVFDPQPALFI